MFTKTRHFFRFSCRHVSCVNLSAAKNIGLLSYSSLACVWRRKDFDIYSVSLLHFH